MKNKLFFGIILILIGSFQLFGKFINLEVFNFIFNYQFLIILIGIYLVLKNKGQSISGIFLIALGCYLYLKDLISPVYLDTLSPIIIIIVGGILLFL